MIKNLGYEYVCDACGKAEIRESWPPSWVKADLVINHLRTVRSSYTTTKEMVVCDDCLPPYQNEDKGLAQRTGIDTIFKKLLSKFKTKGIKCP